MSPPEAHELDTASVVDGTHDSLSANLRLIPLSSCANYFKNGTFGYRAWRSAKEVMCTMRNIKFSLLSHD